MIGVIETYTGRMLNVLDPNEDDIDIIDIAHGLASMPRWAGQSKTPISVAIHSIWVADLVPDEYKLEALLHDATEAYLMDMPKPIKQALPAYQRIEKKLDSVIRRKYHLPIGMSSTVKKADDEILEREHAHLKNQKMLGYDYSHDELVQAFMMNYEKHKNY